MPVDTSRFRHGMYSRKSAADLLRDPEDGGLRLSKGYLKQLCKEMKQYTTPELNDQLYLHFKGFRRIEALEEYTGLRCLWLEGNGLSQLEGLECNTELRGLYAQQNCFREIKNLSQLVQLDSLNLANNSIAMVQGLAGLSVLNTLNLSHNKLTDYESLKGLLECPSIGVLDLSNNSIEEQECWRVLKNMPNLRVLNLMGNKIKSTTKQYRKSTITDIKTLTYLDDRPVFPKERACAEAFMEGGRDAERATREEWVRKDRERQMRGVQHVLAIRDEAQRRARAGDPGFDPDPLDASDAEGEDPDREKTEEDAGYEDWQFGDKQGAQPKLPNMYDQISGNMDTDLTKWQPHPDFADERGEAEADRAALEPSSVMAGVTGPKAADIDLFDDDDEYDVLPQDYEQQQVDPAAGAIVGKLDAARRAFAAAQKAAAADGSFIAAPKFAGAKPGFVFRSGLAGLGYYRDAAKSGGGGDGGGGSSHPYLVSAGKQGRSKVLIEEVGGGRPAGSPEAVVEDGAAAEPMVELVGTKQPDGDSEEDEIAEEIVGRGRKKWYENTHVEPVPVSVGSRSEPKIVEIVDDDDDAAPPPLEQVDVSTGDVISTIGSHGGGAAKPRRAKLLIEEVASDPGAAAASGTKRSKPLIEVIGGDDVDGLD